MKKLYPHARARPREFKKMRCESINSRFLKTFLGQQQDILVWPESWRERLAHEVKDRVLVVPVVKAKVYHSILEFYLLIHQFLRFEFV